MSLSVILSRGMITEIIRFFYSRERPFSEIGFSPLIGADAFDSFPSGHAAAFFALATAVFFLNRRAGKWFFALSALIALARVFCGVHWPLDVLAGAIIGVLSALLARKFVPGKGD
jgi:undecaprenyl-diphosphatase